MFNFFRGFLQPFSCQAEEVMEAFKFVSPSDPFRLSTFFKAGPRHHKMFNKFMYITMNSSLFFLLLLVPATGARYVSGGAIETHAGVIPMDGVSPVPTEAPSFDGIPKELRKRDIPSSWCGMIDGISDSDNIVMCSSYTSCVLKSNFYFACCTNLNTDLCFNTVTPTACIDYRIWTIYRSVNDLTRACSKSALPYCLTVTSSGLTPLFGCDTTSLTRIHSFVPVEAYFGSLGATTTRILGKSSITTAPYFRTTTPVSDGDSDFWNKKKSGLPTAAKAGIGSGVGLVALSIVVFLAFCFRRRRNRAHAPPTDGSAPPVMATTNNMPKDYQSAAQPVQQQYQPQPQGYQGAAAPPFQQQYQPQPHGYQNSTQQYQPQLDHINFPDSADTPPYTPAPIYTSGIQNISAAPNEPTSDTKIASNYPNSTVPSTTAPLSPNHSHQTHQLQQQDPAPPRDYPPQSPISTLGPERSDLRHQDIPPTHSELGAGEAGVHHHHTGTPWNHSELGTGLVDHSGLPRNPSELSGAGEPTTHYPGPPNNNHSELGP